MQPPGPADEGERERQLTALRRLASVLGAHLLVEERDDLVAPPRAVARERGTTYVLVGEPRPRARPRAPARAAAAAADARAPPGVDVRIVADRKLAGACDFFTALAADDNGRRSSLRLEELGVTVFAGPARATSAAGSSTSTAGASARSRSSASGSSRTATTTCHGSAWTAVDAVYFTGGDEGAFGRPAARAARRHPRAYDTLHSAGIQLDALVRSANDPGEQQAEQTWTRRHTSSSPRPGRAASGWAGPQAPPLEGGPAPGPKRDAYGAGDSFAAGLDVRARPDIDPEEALHLAARSGAHKLTAAPRTRASSPRLNSSTAAPSICPARRRSSASSACSSANTCDRRADRNPGASSRNSCGVAPREVRDRAQHALVPQVVVRERRDVAHVDPGAHDHAARRAARASAAGTSSPAGAKMIAASSGSGGGVVASPAHSAPSARASACASVVAGAREREHPPALRVRRPGR